MDLKLKVAIGLQYLLRPVADSAVGAFLTTDFDEQFRIKDVECNFFGMAVPGFKRPKKPSPCSSNLDR